MDLYQLTFMALEEYATAMASHRIEISSSPETGTPNPHAITPVLDDDFVKSAIKLLETHPALNWKPLSDPQKQTNAKWGYHPDWVDPDFNVDGIRDIVFSGDKYISSKWCPNHSYFYTDEENQPLFIADAMPAPGKEIENLLSELAGIKRELEEFRFTLKHNLVKAIAEIDGDELDDARETINDILDNLDEPEGA